MTIAEHTDSGARDWQAGVAWWEPPAYDLSQQWREFVAWSVGYWRAAREFDDIMHGMPWRHFEANGFVGMAV